MDYEKKSKDAISTIKQALRQLATNGVPVGNMIEAIKDIEEKYAESEDERIRKELLDFFKNKAEKYPNDPKYKNISAWIDWLDKQGEQKTTLPIWKYKNDNLPLLRDSLILNKYGCVAKLPSGAIVCDVWVIDYAELAKLPKEEVEKQGEQKPADNEMIEILRTEYEKGRADAITEMQNPAWSEEDEEMLKMVIKSCEQCGNEYAYYWLKSLKDRVQPQPKWSKEDEKIYQSIMDDTVQENQLDDKQTNWLNSLKDRYTWEPSKEQMKALKEACDEHFEPDGLDPLYTLWEQLKKLREE